MLPRDRLVYPATVPTASFEQLTIGMQTALDQAWASIRAGSLGIGAAATTDDHELIATGRNRINETDPGEDLLAGTSVAHAEMNVLAKLPYREHDSVVLHTTLQPCVQCLGAIRLSSVTEVHVLAPDPLFRGIERMRDVIPFLGRRWPQIEQRVVDEWSAFALLYPTHHMRSHPTLGTAWTATLPAVSELVREVESAEIFEEAASVVDAASRIWDRLSECVAEVAVVAADHGD